MITAEQVLYNLHMQLHPNGECKRAFCSHRGQAAKLAPLVHDMIKEACAETAEDTRERMVAAAARAVERDGVIEEPAVSDAAQPPIIICEPRKDCADPHIHRWHCMRGHDGADPGVCPLEYCDRKGANR